MIKISKNFKMFFIKFTDEHNFHTMSSFFTQKYKYKTIFKEVVSLVLIRL